jgi:hypothetical protein
VLKGLAGKTLSCKNLPYLLTLSFRNTVNVRLLSSPGTFNLRSCGMDSIVVADGHTQRIGEQVRQAEKDDYTVG